MYRISVIALICCVSTAVSAQEASPLPQTSRCFAVIEGKSDVPPGVPILVNTCSGQTFMLSRSRRGSKQRSYQWIPITQPKQSGQTEQRTSRATTRTSKQATRQGCFSYGGRTFCP
jgi:hypothetical protein